MSKWYKKGDSLIKIIEKFNEKSNVSSIRGWFIGQCGFIFKFKNKIIAIDPVLNDFTLSENSSSQLNYELAFAPDALKIDYVFCTHGHPDHFECKTIVGLCKKNPSIKIIIPSGCYSLARDSGIGDDNLVLVEPNQKILIDKNLKLLVNTFSAAHPVHVYEKDNPSMCLCYNILFDNISIVHLGDTYLTKDLYENLKSIEKIDLFLPPINGDDFFKREANFIGNMEAEESAKLANALNVKLSIPTHYDMVKGNTADPARFINKLHELNPQALYKLPKLGQDFCVN